MSTAIYEYDDEKEIVMTFRIGAMQVVVQVGDTAYTLAPGQPDYPSNWSPWERDVVRATLLAAARTLEDRP